MKKTDWSNVEAAETYATPPAGGYILAICEVEDHPDKEYLKIYCDIAGVADKSNEQFIGYYGQRKERSGGQIPLFSFIRSYKESARGFFKAFLVALEKSDNAGFIADKFSGNEQEFCGMTVGAVMGAEEYVYNNKVRVRLKAEKFCSTDRIQKGDFTIPAFKKLDPSEIPATSGDNVSSYVPFSDNEIPF
ncbi:MAG: hypothetical protein SPI35_07945 [Porphyromonas sp.]|nr:hypothetical protein [Porphyromonas sp.]